MQDAILADQLVPEAQLHTGWRAATTAIAHRTRAALMAHPWSPAAFTDASFGPNAMRHMEQNLAALAGTSLTRQRKFELIAAVDAYVLGASLQAIETLFRTGLAQTDPESVAAAVEFGIDLLHTGEFPHLSALDDKAPDNDSAAPAMTDSALTEQFDRGLDALLDGLTTRLSIG
jgi:hypothetical protein